MSNYYLKALTPEKISEAKKNGEYDIRQARRRAEAARAIAGSMDNAYVTKRILDKLTALIPNVKHIYLNARNYAIELNISYLDSTRYSDDIFIPLCKPETRRIDAQKLLKDAEMYEAEAREKEENLARLDAAVEYYNDVADRYARVYNVLKSFLYGDLPYPDYNLEKKYEKEPFDAPVPLPDPVPLRVLPPAGYVPEKMAAGSEAPASETLSMLEFLNS